MIIISGSSKSMSESAKVIFYSALHVANKFLKALFESTKVFKFNLLTFIIYNSYDNIMFFFLLITFVSCFMIKKVF